MSIADIIIIILVIALVVFSIFLALRRKKKGIKSCGCDCPGCNIDPKEKNIDNKIDCPYKDQNK